ncbi:MAG: TonB-dependent receptor plug domain-containing protein [Bacteroidetes bacterium]|nr:TonB-dependent receptor plug domain-containing protein [Bacteroidota bacterium]
MKLFFSFLFSLSFVILSEVEGFSQQNFQPTVLPKDTFDYFEMSLEQLLTLKAHGVPSELEELINQLILAASKKPLTARESPGIVTLITDEEIRNSGARDLIDVLRLVPGIDFGVDVEGVVGLGTRGLWAHEGKMLVLLDGQEMNELLFATNQFGNHFPVDQIKKIEVMRGPGSAIYGGFAEYGVINIITKSAVDLPGISLTGTYGQMESATGRRNFNLSAGKIKKDFEFTIGAFVGSANRSDQNYSDLYGNSYNMTGNSQLNPTHINAGMAYKGFSARWILDLYQTTTRDSYDSIKTFAYPLDFKSHFFELKYAAVAGKKKKLTITPKLNIKSQTPWQTITNIDTLAENYNKAAQRFTGNITASYNLTRKINFIAGVEAYSEKAVDQSDSGKFYNGKKTVSYFNQAYFLQCLAKTRFVNFILGARYDIHSDYGSAFAPRIGLTKKINRFHFKLLYSNSFRAPSIENINLGHDSIKPEYTSVKEFEIGYQLTRKSLFTANVFDITTKNPIVYYFNDSLYTDNYKNYGEAGSTGMELEYRVRDKWGYLIANYSFYTVSQKKKIADYSVPGHFDMLLSFPSHKANVSAWFKAGKHFGISTTLSYIGARYGYSTIDSAENSVLEKFPSILLANFFINVGNFGVKGLTVGAGCYDILDSKYKFIQPYNGYHAPLPGPSREILVKIIYEVKSEKKQRR